MQERKTALPARDEYALVTDLIDFELAFEYGTKKKRHRYEIQYGEAKIAAKCQNNELKREVATVLVSLTKLIS